MRVILFAEKRLEKKQTQFPFSYLKPEIFPVFLDTRKAINYICNRGLEP